VIELKELHGLQYHEIAETLKLSIGTVMSRLFYARKRLQSLLGEMESWHVAPRPLPPEVTKSRPATYDS
jgi:predicted DNA-binding protein (UPF0251 family)